MILKRLNVTTLLFLSVLILPGITAHIFAATRIVNQSRVGGDKVSQAPTKQPEKSLNPGAKKRPALTHDQATTLAPQSGKQVAGESKPVNSKGHHRLKVSKKVSPKAIVRPRTDLTYHGMLEDSRRYDPRANHRTAGIQDPQALALAHDHFQELDRNQDGRIDPMERAFGRLDMDRDLPNYHR